MRLLPKKSPLFDRFDQHARLLVEMSGELKGLFERFDNATARQSRIKDLEHACDEITHSVNTSMHEMFVTPLDKDDIADLISELDDVADDMDAVACRVQIYRLTESRKDAHALTQILEKAVQQVCLAVENLRHGNQRAVILEACRQVHLLENECDAVYREALTEIFNTPGIDPIVLVKWDDVLGRLEKAVDRCEDVCNVLESIQLKYA